MLAYDFGDKKYIIPFLKLKMLLKDLSNIIQMILKKNMALNPYALIIATAAAVGT